MFHHAAPHRRHFCRFFRRRRCKKPSQIIRRARATGHPRVNAKATVIALMAWGLNWKAELSLGPASWNTSERTTVRSQMNAHTPTRDRSRRCPKPKCVHAPVNVQKTAGRINNAISPLRVNRSIQRLASSRAKKAIGKAWSCKTNRVRLASTFRYRFHATRLGSS